MRTHKQKEVRRKQRARRRQNNHDVHKQKGLFEMIDGNETHYPYAYCLNKGGDLTKSLALTHKCEAKNCCSFRSYIKN